MRYGNHVRLFTLGAVLAFAVHVDLDVVEVATVGRILMVAAVAGALVELLQVRRARAVRPAPTAPATPARPVTGPGSCPATGTAWTAGRTRPYTPRSLPHQES
ncbi:hypothetical protein [Kineococcus rhizosphaerae]|uniref:Uncharacterized protein n=1 Tax=Kineococcus rhizosphaerae TaxID=559628 RepID=A0A2T0R9V9_9ACTN|nr:hypothetical protein [Kineococcus rhizosphaerae]PRY17947.1 hypothetical protein CLV37_101189 [Kineococcus rhizosphaerae]